MKIDLEKLENNVIKMDIEIPAKEAVDNYNRAVQKISQNINIPGFRRGKAPRKIVEQHVGTDRIKYEALENFLPRLFQNVIRDEKLDVVAQPQVESYDYNIGEPLKIIAKVELRPEVKLGKYKGLKVTAEEYSTPKDAFDNALNELKEKAISYEIVIDRPTIETDLVTFDFEGFSNGEKIKNGEGKNYTLDLANSSFIPGFAEQLTGHSIDEEFEINVKFPDEYHEDKLKGQNAIFKIKIHEIKQKVEPELNDDFAKRVGPFETMNDLENNIQKYLDEMKQNNNQRKAEVAIFEKVLEGIEVNIQPSMIEREEKVLLEEYIKRLEQQGFTLEQAIEQHGEELIMEPLKKDAEKRVKNALVIDKIAQEEDIKLENSDLEGKLEEMANAYQVDKVTIMQQLAQNPAFLNGLSQQALNEKVMNFLVKNNEIEFKEVKEKKPAKKAKEKIETEKEKKTEIKKAVTKKKATKKKDDV